MNGLRKITFFNQTQKKILKSQKWPSDKKMLSVKHEKHIVFSRVAGWWGESASCLSLEKKKLRAEEMLNG